MAIFTNELKREQVKVQTIARRAGLNFIDIVYDVLDMDQMAEVASYHGFPDHYSHWKFGEEYENMRKKFSFDMSKIYEMVINTDPSIGYLLAENKIIDQKLVMAHVCAHVDFFTHNEWFRPTDKKMLETSRSASERIEKYREEFGEDVVDDFITDCMKIENLIDSSAPYITSPQVKQKKENAKPKKGEEILRFKSSDFPYLDSFLNPPDWIEKQEKKIKEKAERDRRVKKGLLFPARPVRDILLFLLRFAPLEEWQRDILDITRQERYYILPQGLTKISNEGWAAYWHSELMVRRRLVSSAEIVDYAKHNAGTLGSPGLNPYKLGLTIFRDIEYRWNTGRHGLIWKYCRPYVTKRGQWDDFIVFKNIYEENLGSVASDWEEWCTFKRVCREGEVGFPKDIFHPKNLVKWWCEYHASYDRVQSLKKELENNTDPDLEDDIKLDIKWFEKLLTIKKAWDSGNISKEISPIPPVFFDLARKHHGRVELGVGRKKIFEVRKRINDYSLISEFFTKALFEQLPMFSYKPGGGGVSPDHWGIDKVEFEDVKKKLLYSLFNMGGPILEVVDTRYSPDGGVGIGLYIRHRHEGVDLQLDEMYEIMKTLYKIWQRSIYLETIVVEEEKQSKIPFFILSKLFNDDEKKQKEKKIKRGKLTIFCTIDGKKVSVSKEKGVKFKTPY